MIKLGTTLSTLLLVLGTQAHAESAQLNNAADSRHETTAKRMIADEAEKPLEHGSARPPAEVVTARAFTRLDANANGMLEKQEVQDTDLDQQTFADADANSDGKLSRKEYGTIPTVLGHEAGAAGG